MAMPKMTPDQNRRCGELLRKFCSADRDLQELENRSDIRYLYLMSGLESLILAHHQYKVIKNTIKIIQELIPHRRRPRHFRYSYSEEFAADIDRKVFSLAMSLVKCSDNAIMLTMIAVRGQFTPAFFVEHRPLVKAVAEEAAKTFQLLRRAAGLSFHGVDPSQSADLLNQLEKFDKVMADFEFAWICDGMDPEIVELLTDIGHLHELFVKAADWGIGKGLVSRDELASSDPAVMTTLPRLAVLFYLTDDVSQPLKDFKVFRKHRDQLTAVRHTLVQVAPSMREAIAKRLCLKIESVDDTSAEELFRTISGAADQMQSNHPADCNYLMSCVCSRFGEDPGNTNCCAGSLQPDHHPSARAHVAARDRGQPANQQDNAAAAAACTNPECGQAFDIFHRRHRCRACGGQFCHTCTRQRLPLPLQGYNDPVPVCQACHVRVAGAVPVVAPPAWAPDSSSARCANTACLAQFTVIRRRHHCRACGRLLCDKCTNARAALPHFGYNEPVRVCGHCFSVHGCLAEK